MSVASICGREVSSDNWGSYNVWCDDVTELLHDYGISIDSIDGTELASAFADDIPPGMFVKEYADNNHIDVVCSTTTHPGWFGI